jgi:hypothetical protein
MTYYIKRSNTDPLVNIADGTLDEKSTSLVLVGKNYPAYGEIFDQNLVYLLENFAHTSAPNYPVQGQLWYDLNSQNIKVYRVTPTQAYWQSLTGMIQSDNKPLLVNNGDLWWDTNNLQLSVYYNNAFTVIGPILSNPGQLRAEAKEFDLQVQGTTVLKTNYQGQINFPYNACVCANYRVNTFGTGYFSGSGIDVPSTYDAVYVPVNNGGYWLSTPGGGVFQCPVDGTYEVHGYVQTLGGATGYDRHRVMWWQNQDYTGLIAENKHSTSTQQQLSIRGFLNCFAGDVLQFMISASSNAHINDSNSGFSIRLVG